MHETITKSTTTYKNLLNYMVKTMYIHGSVVAILTRIYHKKSPIIESVLWHDIDWNTRQWNADMYPLGPRQLPSPNL